MCTLNESKRDLCPGWGRVALAVGFGSLRRSTLCRDSHRCSKHGLCRASAIGVLPQRRSQWATAKKHTPAAKALCPIAASSSSAFVCGLRDSSFRALGRRPLDHRNSSWSMLMFPPAGEVNLASLVALSLWSPSLPLKTAIAVMFLGIRI